MRILLVLGWVLTRVLLVQQTYGEHRWIFGDVHYYFNGITQDSGLREYPEANLWLIRLIDSIAPAGSEDHYYVAFILLLDALFFAMLIRRKHDLAGAFWVVFGLLVGPIFLTRLDLVPGLLVGLFAYLLARRPNWSAVALGAATMMKLWPGVLATVLVGHYKAKSTWIRVGVFGGTMLAMALVTIVTQGWDRLLSPMDYQSERGLQIESVAATPFIVLASTGGGHYEIGYAASKSFEITGPGVEAATQVASIALLAVVAFGLVMVFLRLRTEQWRSWEAIALAMVLIVAMLVTNKVFSPQYVVWLAPIMAVALCFSAARQTRVAAVLVLVITWLTWVVYPANYDSLMTNDPDFVPTLALATRNILMLVLLGVCVSWWRLERTKPMTPTHE